MKVRVATFLVVLQAFLVSSALAGSAWLGVEGGSSVPVGTFADNTRAGVHGSVSLSFLPQGAANSGGGLQIDYHHFGQGEAAWFGFVGVSARPDVANAMLFARANLTSSKEPCGPYFRAGIGATQVMADVAFRTPIGSFTEHASERWATLMAGLGWALPAGTGQRVELEALFHQIESSPNVSYVTAGVTLSLNVDR